MNPIKYNAPWDTLQKVCVGSTYSPKFFDDIKNSKIRELLQKIVTETEEDYLSLIHTLNSFNIEVVRPLISNNCSILNFVNNAGCIDYKSSQSFTLIPRPPMQPRDSFLIVGDQVLLTNHESLHFLNFLPDNYIVSEIKFDAPLATVVGDTIVVDCREHPNLGEYLKKIFPNYTIKSVYIGGHNDAVFSLTKPGLIISTYHHENYVDTFPGWIVKYIENQSWNAIPEWRKLKHKNIGNWWSPEKINNPEFEHFVDTWLTNWLGFVEETVFDVNMLQINEQTVLVNNYNKELFNFLKIQKVEALVVPFRHRFFWDGGLHCITNDLYRDGEIKKYV
jgi:hypothetical protein